MADARIIDVSRGDVEDLRRRLLDTRWPQTWPSPPGSSTGWEAGTDLTELRRLVRFWAEDFDWAAQQALIEALPWNTADLDGTPVAYLRFDAEVSGNLPIVLTNGWPSTALELVDLARRLATPSLFGGNPDSAVTVIVPALPGLPFSPQRPSMNDETHELWHRLMTDHLGFARYAAHGGDLGAGITSRPLTLAPALSDSPVGLLSWILEKHRAWSDCGGDVSTRFSDTYLATLASVYWFTNSIGTSFRPYYEFAAGFTTRVDRVEVPTAVAVFPHDLATPPRSWAERTYNVTRYTLMPRGGHFAPHEEPALLGDDIRAFLRTL